jgi:hypothetical protein
MNERKDSHDRNGVRAMRRTVFFLLVAIVGAVGCRNVAGPLEARGKSRADLPGYSIEEQERRGRDRLATFEDDPRIGPNTYISRPGPTGR